MANEAPQIKNLGPDYAKIFTDIITLKFPERKQEFKNILKAKELSVFEVISINNRLFGEKRTEQTVLERRYRAYNKQSILTILRFQKKQKLRSSELAIIYGISRNTIKKWIDIFGHLI